jgi:hypothetical protein
MYTTIFNPRLPILADELAVQGQFAKGDKEEEWWQSPRVIFS